MGKIADNILTNTAKVTTMVTRLKRLADPTNSIPDAEFVQFLRDTIPLFDSPYREILEGFYITGVRTGHSREKRMHYEIRPALVVLIKMLREGKWTLKH